MECWCKRVGRNIDLFFNGFLLVSFLFGSLASVVVALFLSVWLVEPTSHVFIDFYVNNIYRGYVPFTQKK